MSFEGISLLPNQKKRRSHFTDDDHVQGHNQKLTNRTPDSYFPTLQQSPSSGSVLSSVTIKHHGNGNDDDIFLTHKPKKNGSSYDELLAEYKQDTTNMPLLQPTRLFNPHVTPESYTLNSTSAVAPVSTDGTKNINTTSPTNLPSSSSTELLASNTPVPMILFQSSFHTPTITQRTNQYGPNGFNKNWGNDNLDSIDYDSSDLGPTLMCGHDNSNTMDNQMESSNNADITQNYYQSELWEFDLTTLKPPTLKNSQLIPSSNSNYHMNLYNHNSSLYSHISSTALSHHNNRNQQTQQNHSITPSQYNLDKVDKIKSLLRYFAYKSQSTHQSLCQFRQSSHSNNNYPNLTPTTATINIPHSSTTNNINLINNNIGATIRLKLTLAPFKNQICILSVPANTSLYGLIFGDFNYKGLSYYIDPQPLPVNNINNSNTNNHDNVGYFPSQTEAYNVSMSTPIFDDIITGGNPTTTKWIPVVGNKADSLWGDVNNISQTRQQGNITITTSNQSPQPSLSSRQYNNYHQYDKFTLLRSISLQALYFMQQSLSITSNRRNTTDTTVKSLDKHIEPYSNEYDLQLSLNW